ncbi:MAG TPA: hypothetical protein QGF05_11600 [Dehalococcoidia bacterium]|nr:hypothetical protein [Dehalococcoidia bacterium]
MDGTLTRNELIAELREASGSARLADAALERALGLLGLNDAQSFTELELLLICEALIREGGTIRERAELLAMDTLRLSVERDAEQPEAA